MGVAAGVLGLLHAIRIAISQLQLHAASCTEIAHDVSGLACIFAGGGGHGGGGHGSGGDGGADGPGEGGGDGGLQ